MARACPEKVAASTAMSDHELADWNNATKHAEGKAALQKANEMLYTPLSNEHRVGVVTKRAWRRTQTPTGYRVCCCACVRWLGCGNMKSTHLDLPNKSSTNASTFAILARDKSSRTRKEKKKEKRKASRDARLI